MWEGVVGEGLRKEKRSGGRGGRGKGGSKVKGGVKWGRGGALGAGLQGVWCGRVRLGRG